MHFTYKNIVLIVVAVLIVGAAFVLAELRNRNTIKAEYEAQNVTGALDALAPELQAQDTDNDYLKDWEEVLIGTNSKKSDTDEDGTNDGAEVVAGRNPLVKGPNDKGFEPAKESAARPLTPTEQVGREFFARYMELSQSGLINDKASQDELIKNVLSNGVLLAKPKAYSLKDVMVGGDTSREAVKKYINEVGAVFKIHADPEARNETLIAKESLEQDNPELLKEIDPIIAMYKNILSALLKISVPASLSQNHVTLINGLSVLAFSAESLRKIDVDALAGLQGTSVWLSGAEDLHRGFTGIKSAITSNGIVYMPEEGGSYFIIQPQQQ